MTLPEHEVRALIDLAAEQPGITVVVDLETQTVACGDLRFSFSIEPSNAAACSRDLTTSG